MDDIVKNKLFWIVVAITMFNIGVFAVGKLVVNKAADEVIERLEKEYSPSPYGPGFDPDKVDPEVLRNQRLYYEIKRSQQELAEEDAEVSAAPPIVASETIQSAEEWAEEWERDRGFNLSQ
jgi:hypothetical protein